MIRVIAKLFLTSPPRRPAPTQHAAAAHDRSSQPRYVWVNKSTAEQCLSFAPETEGR